MQPQWTIMQKRRCTQSETYPAQKLRSYLNTPLRAAHFLVSSSPSTVFQSVEMGIHHHVVPAALDASVARTISSHSYLCWRAMTYVPGTTATVGSGMS